jgi:hypothetical protein
MKNLKLVVMMMAAALVAVSQLQAAPVQATVTSLKGTAEVMKPGTTEFKPLKVNQVVKVGSTIKTGKGSELVLEPMPSIKVTIGESAEITIVELDFAKSGEMITKRKAVLDLKEGKAFSELEKLDPKTTDYQLKMPQGVAAARGTKYTVSVSGGIATVSVQEGSVTMTDAAGNSYTIGAGQSMSFNMTGATGAVSGGVFTDPSALSTVLNPANISGVANDGRTPNPPTPPTPPHPVSATQ